MSTEIYDLKDVEKLSTCCGAPVYTDTDICSDCKEHCGINCMKENCEEEATKELVNGEWVCEKCYNLIQDEIKKVKEKISNS